MYTYDKKSKESKRRVIANNVGQHDNLIHSFGREVKWKVAMTPTKTQNDSQVIQREEILNIANIDKELPSIFDIVESSQRLKKLFIKMDAPTHSIRDVAEWNQLKQQVLSMKKEYQLEWIGAIVNSLQKENIIYYFLAYAISSSNVWLESIFGKSKYGAENSREKDGTVIVAMNELKSVTGNVNITTSGLTNCHAIILITNHTRYMYHNIGGDAATCEKFDFLLGEAKKNVGIARVVVVTGELSNTFATNEKVVAMQDIVTENFKYTDRWEYVVANSVTVWPTGLYWLSKRPYPHKDDSGTIV